MSFYTNLNSNINHDCVKHIIGVNIIIYMAIIVFSQYKIDNVFSLYNPLLDDKFRIFQIFTHMFIHSKNYIFHIIFNMLALFMFGTQIENIIGTKKFIILYILSGISAAFLQSLFNISLIFYFFQSLNFYKINGIINYLDEIHKPIIYSSMYSPMIGASGAISGIVGSFTKFFPEHKIFIFPFPFPIRVKKAILIFIFGSILSIIFNISPDIAHLAHIGGILSGYFISYYYLKYNNIYF